MVDLIFNEYPWLKYLDDWSILHRHVHEWQATAEIYADPALFRALTKPPRLDDGPVRAAVRTTRWMIRTWGGRRLRLGHVMS